MLKYELIPAQLLHEGLIAPANLFAPEMVDEQTILMTHKQNYWKQLRDLTLPAAAQRRIGFPLSKELIERERKIAQGTIDGCRFAIENGVAFNIAGGTHHAGSDWGEGFCLLNDQAMAANYLLNKGLCQSILIVDLDVHQGNGTAEIFRNDPRVFTFSMHGANNFPYRKERSSRDLALSDGVGDDEYLSLLQNTLPGLIDEQQPDFLFYLAGTDVLATDKLGKLNLSIGGCKERDQIVLQLCQRHQIPVQVSMGGGYSADIKIIVNAHCNTYRVAYDLFF
jgi:acetoin utilization deacetylase AcuC-like enzyme